MKIFIKVCSIIFFSVLNMFCNAMESTICPVDWNKNSYDENMLLKDPYVANIIRPQLRALRDKIVLLEANPSQFNQICDEYKFLAALDRQNRFGLE